MNNCEQCKRYSEECKRYIEKIILLQTLNTNLCRTISDLKLINKKENEADSIKEGNLKKEYR